MFLFVCLFVLFCFPELTSNSSSFPQALPLYMCLGVKYAIPHLDKPGVLHAARPCHGTAAAP